MYSRALKRMENPEADFDVLSLRSMNERYHNDASPCLYQKQSHLQKSPATCTVKEDISSCEKSLESFVRDFTIDDSISGCFADSDLDDTSSETTTSTQSSHSHPMNRKLTYNEGQSGPITKQIYTPDVIEQFNNFSRKVPIKQKASEKIPSQTKKGVPTDPSTVKTKHPSSVQDKATQNMNTKQQQQQSLSRSQPGNTRTSSIKNPNKTDDNIRNRNEDQGSESQWTHKIVREHPTASLFGAQLIIPPKVANSITKMHIADEKIPKQNRLPKSTTIHGNQIKNIYSPLESDILHDSYVNAATARRHRNSSISDRSENKIESCTISQNSMASSTDRPKSTTVSVGQNHLTLYPVGQYRMTSSPIESVTALNKTPKDISKYLTKVDTGLDTYKRNITKVNDQNDAPKPKESNLSSNSRGISQMYSHRRNSFGIEIYEIPNEEIKASSQKKKDCCELMNTSSGFEFRMDELNIFHDKDNEKLDSPPKIDQEEVSKKIQEVCTVDSRIDTKIESALFLVCEELIKYCCEGNTNFQTSHAVKTVGQSTDYKEDCVLEQAGESKYSDIIRSMLQNVTDMFAEEREPSCIRQELRSLISTHIRSVVKTKPVLFPLNSFSRTSTSTLSDVEDGSLERREEKLQQQQQQHHQHQILKHNQKENKELQLNTQHQNNLKQKHRQLQNQQQHQHHQQQQQKNDHQQPKQSLPDKHSNHLLRQQEDKLSEDESETLSIPDIGSYILAATISTLESDDSGRNESYDSDTTITKTICSGSDDTNNREGNISFRSSSSNTLYEGKSNTSKRNKNNNNTNNNTKSLCNHHRGSSNRSNNSNNVLCNHCTKLNSNSKTPMIYKHYQNSSSGSSSISSGSRSKKFDVKNNGSRSLRKSRPRSHSLGDFVSRISESSQSETMLYSSSDEEIHCDTKHETTNCNEHTNNQCNAINESHTQNADHLSFTENIIKKMLPKDKLMQGMKDCKHKCICGVNDTNIGDEKIKFATIRNIEESKNNEYNAIEDQSISSFTLVTSETNSCEKQKNSEKGSSPKRRSRSEGARMRENESKKEYERRCRHRSRSTRNCSCHGSCSRKKSLDERSKSRRNFTDTKTEDDFNRWINEKDYTDNEDGARVPINTLSDEALRSQRLKRHLQSVQMLREKNNDVIETVITGTGEMLAPKLPSRDQIKTKNRTHINIGVAYPFRPTSQDLKSKSVENCLTHSKISPGKAKWNKPKDGRFGSKLFNYTDRNAVDGKARELTESEFEETFDRRNDATVRRRREMDAGIPWDQLEFSAHESDFTLTDWSDGDR